MGRISNYVIDKEFLEKIGKHPIFKGSENILSAFVEALNNKDMVFNAISCLSNIGDESTITPLENFIQHTSDHKAKTEAKMAIHNINKRESSEQEKVLQFKIDF